MGYYGHSGAAWFVLIPFGIAILVRLMAGSSRRRNRGRPQAPGSFFTGPPGGAPYAAPPKQAPPQTRPGEGTSTGGTPAGWFRDPFVRHEQRYWSGSEWTDHCLDSGVPSSDPPPESSRPTTDS